MSGLGAVSAGTANGLQARSAANQFRWQSIERCSTAGCRERAAIQGEAGAAKASIGNLATNV